MTATPTSIDFFASIVILIILVISGFTLLGTGVLMAIGAMFTKRPLVTSWPADQEHSFEPYERRSASAGSLAWAFSLIGAIVLTIIATGIYFGVTPERKDMTKDMNMSNLNKRRTPAPPRADTPAPAEAPKAEAPAESPKSDTPPPAPKQ